MSNESRRDPRAVLVEEKHFTLRPKPLERWIWQQGIPAAAERVFWMHWEEGMRRRDWCSELALVQVARTCCIDISTVTRAYQLLKRCGLIRREDPGRDPSNPFQRAIAVTEVRVPRELLVTLGQSPNRRASRLEAPIPAAQSRPSEPARPELAEEICRGKPAESPRLERAEWRAVMEKLSAGERVEFFNASKDRRTAMHFDEATTLNPEERGYVLAYLARTASRLPDAPAPRKRESLAAAQVAPKSRKVSSLEAARVRRAVVQAVPATHAHEVFRQVLWSVEEGALRRFEVGHATNIALKKIREGSWTRPNQMPPNWMISAARIDTCSAA
jgi:hypothetical protein